MNLFSQLMEAIGRRDTLTFNEVFIDGTKLELMPTSTPLSGEKQYKKD